MDKGNRYAAMHWAGYFFYKRVAPMGQRLFYALNYININQMKKNHIPQVFKYCALLFFVVSMLFSCKRNHAKLSKEQNALVKDSVSRMAANIAADISKNGPRAWLNYFEDNPDFFMANEGQLVFKDYPSAKHLS
jgi:hypothetical protein